MSKLIAITLASLLVFISVGQFALADNQTNISEVYNGLTYEAVKNKIKNEKYAMDMARNSTNMMDQSEQTNKEFIHNYLAKNPLPTVNQTSQFAIDKLVKGKENSGYMTDGMTNYILTVQDQHRKILSLLSSYLVNGRNSAPDYVPCAAWHDCKIIPVEKSSWTIGKIIPTNQTHFNSTITLKPEFKKFPSGIVSNNGTIHNMTELNTWMTQNKTK